MSLATGYVTFNEFFRTAYDAATCEPFLTQFKESCKNGDREAMVKVVMDIPPIRNAKIAESCKGKNDVMAREIYNKIRTNTGENENRHDQKSRACMLNEALFAASASNRLFLDALLDCAKYWHESNDFLKCLKYCECMLALPSSFYDKTAENANYFSTRKEECVRLERECFEKLGGTSSRKKKRRGGQNAIRDTLENTLVNKVVKAIPVVDGKRHKTIESCSDAVDLRFDEKRGRHLVATRNIEAGTVLIVDQPFSFSTDKEALERNCFRCQITLKLENSVKIPCRYCQAVSFCSEKCRREAWQMYHQYECSIFNLFHENDSNHPQRRLSHLLLAYRTTIAGALSSTYGTTNEEFQVPFLNDDFLRYHTANINRAFAKPELNEAYSPHDYRTVLKLKTHCSSIEPAINLIRTIEAIFLAKCFTFVLSKFDVVCSKETITPLATAMLHHLQAINCNAYEIVENVYDETTHVWEPRYVGGAIYSTVSLVNHSCYPNVVRHSYPSGTVTVRALRFIGKGTEILDCYGPHFLIEGKLTRREYLWKKYRFLCECEACTENWQYPLPETINYKCKVCAGTIDTVITNKRDKQNLTCKQCPKCHDKIDRKKLENQLRKSVEKKFNAIGKMYQGRYEEALPLLLEHVHFIEKFFAAPNIETIKTQQCIIQCYNKFGSTSQ